MLNKAIISKVNILYGRAPQEWETCLKNSIYCTSNLEIHSTCRKDPNSTESVEEAALKASGPMPCALLIVTSAFLSSNSDWWVRQGGGVFFRGDRERLVVKNSVLKSHLSCQRADMGHPGTWGLWCTESGHWPSFPPSALIHNQATPLLLQHPTYNTLLSRLISSVLYCHLDLNELPHSADTSSTSHHCVLSRFLQCFHVFLAILLMFAILEVILKIELH